MVSTRLDPQEVAVALGVRQDTLEHWIDEGWLPTNSVETGDRRIDLAQALRFIRHHHLTVRRPDALGLKAGSAGPDCVDRERQQLIHAMQLPDADVLTHLFVSRFAIWPSFAEYADRVVVPTANRPELAALSDPIPRCVDAMHALLQYILPDAPQAPAAVAGAVDGAADALPPAIASIVLAEQGYATTDVGPVPAPTLVRLALERQPKLVFVHLGHAGARPGLLDEQVAYLAGQLHTLGARLVLCGQAAQRLPGDATGRVVTADTMTSLGNWLAHHTTC